MGSSCYHDKSLFIYIEGGIQTTKGDIVFTREDKLLFGTPLMRDIKQLGETVTEGGAEF